MQLTVRGTWPGPVVLRRGWALAEARPWNQDVADAQLRLVRGGQGFLRSCTEHLLENGAPAVVSPPLPESSRRMWLDVGYSEFQPLDLWERDLTSPLADPGHEVESAEAVNWRSLLQIDRAAFDPLWRLDRAGLEEAMAATPRSCTLVVRRRGETVAFAVVGSRGTYSYLQRLAVHPAAQGGGVGRALVRASLRWGRRGGGRLLLLNTQPDNRRAAALYRSESFARLPERLSLVRAAS